MLHSNSEPILIEKRTSLISLMTVNLSNHRNWPSSQRSLCLSPRSSLPTQLATWRAPQTCRTIRWTWLITTPTTCRFIQCQITILQSKIMTFSFAGSNLDSLTRTRKHCNMCQSRSTTRGNLTAVSHVKYLLRIAQSSSKGFDSMLVKKWLSMI